jgi:alpha-N-acetylglucosaminidase
MRLNWTATLLACAAFGAAPADRGTDSSREAEVRRMISRLLPRHAPQVAIETIASANGRDVFEIETRNRKLVLRGNNGVSVASALNWYLKHNANSQISFYSRSLPLPDRLPAVPRKVRRESPFRYRYFLNFCAFSYTLAWWDWNQWEQLIDWMALHGTNMPLAVTGQEATWYKVYRGMGLEDREIREYFVGAGYLPFGWMGCLDKWGGPLPMSWIDSHLELQKKILAR